MSIPKTDTVVALGGNQSAVSQVTAPLYAVAAAAGFPAPGDDLVEANLNIHDYVVKHPDATFFARVTGDSMEGAGIFAGDIVVVDRAITPSAGRIVVAAVNGELVIKRLERQGSALALVSANEAYAPIRIGETETAHIWGVVVGSVRQF